MQRDDDSFMLVPSKGEDYMAGWHLDTKMAQDIVARTMRIIDTNINVMDARGRIIGSGADQLRQIFTGQRLAAGKAQLYAAHRSRLAKDLDPLFGGQLLFLPGEVQRIGTVGTLQRAAVGQLRQQPQRRIDGGFILAHGR